MQRSCAEARSARPVQIEGGDAERRGASVNGWSRWIEFQKIVALAINFGAGNQYKIWLPCYCCAVGEGFLFLKWIILGV